MLPKPISMVTMKLKANGSRHFQERIIAAKEELYNKCLHFNPFPPVTDASATSLLL